MQKQFDLNNFEEISKETEFNENNIFVMKTDPLGNVIEYYATIGENPFEENSDLHSKFNQIRDSLDFISLDADKETVDSYYVRINKDELYDNSFFMNSISDFIKPDLAEASNAFFIKYDTQLNVSRLYYESGVGTQKRIEFLDALSRYLNSDVKQGVDNIAAINEESMYIFGEKEYPSLYINKSINW